MPKAKDESRRRYRTEPLARDALLSGLANFFDFHEEVSATGPNGDNFWFDAIGVCQDNGWTIGFDVKKSHLFKSEFADSLRQTIHYRHARITDPRLPNLMGSSLPAMLLFPDWLGEHDDDSTNYAGEAEGMRLLAAQFRVGTLRKIESDRFSMFMGQNAVWHSNRGWSKTADGILFGKRGLGSVRKKDS